MASSEPASNQPGPGTPTPGPTPDLTTLGSYFSCLPPSAIPEHSFREEGSFHPSLTFSQDD